MLALFFYRMLTNKNRLRSYCNSQLHSYLVCFYSLTKNRLLSRWSFNFLDSNRDWKIWEEKNEVRGWAKESRLYILVKPFILPVEAFLWDLEGRGFTVLYSDPQANKTVMFYRCITQIEYGLKCFNLMNPFWLKQRLDNSGYLVKNVSKNRSNDTTLLDIDWNCLCIGGNATRIVFRFFQKMPLLQKTNSFSSNSMPQMPNQH